MEKYRWELADTSGHTNTGYVHGNTKLHLFNQLTGGSACNRYWQVPGCYLEHLYDGQDKHFCKKCLKKYKKLQEKQHDK